MTTERQAREDEWRARLTPEQYRERYKLAPDYPMVAPAYARKRQELAKKIGLGRKPRTVEAEPTPQPKARRSRAS